MRVNSLVVGVLSLATLASCQWYPQTQKGEIPAELKGYLPGQEMFLECIQRQIDNGEHKFDDQERIIYAPFPKCKESGKGLAIKYGVTEDVNCTIGFSDELYHLFQLYIHEDAPFSCRIPLSPEAHYLEKGGAYIPVTFNFRGEIHDLHLDIDHTLNVVAIGAPLALDANEGTLVSATAWSSGTNASRVVIGDFLTLNLAVRWLNGLTPVGASPLLALLPIKDGFYRLPKLFMNVSSEWFTFYVILAALLGASLQFGFTYCTKMNSRKHPRWADVESGLTKKD